MKNLILRRGKHYLGNREIVGNGDLGQSILKAENVKLQSSAYDSIFVCENFSEAKNEIQSTFACFIRFYERFNSKYEMYIWIASDAQGIKLVDEHLGTKRRNFLDEWPYPNYSKLKRQIQLISNRTFIIRKKWLPKLQEMLLD